MPMGFENSQDDVYGSVPPRIFLTNNGKILIKKSYQRKNFKEIEFDDGTRIDFNNVDLQ